MDEEMFDVGEDYIDAPAETIEINEESEIVEDVEIIEDTEIIEEPEIIEDMVITEEPEIVEETEITEEPETIEDLEINEDTEITEEPEIIEDTDITEEPEIVEDTELSEEPEIIEDTEITEEPEIIEDTEITEEPEIIEDTEITEEPEIIEDTETTEESEIADDGEIAEEPEIVEDTEITEASEIIEDTEITEEAEIIEDPEITEPAESIDDNVTYNNLSDYLSAHNYGKDDYDTYSQDPEWRRLMQIEYPETELPPLTQETIDDILSPYEGKTYDSIAEYYGDHNFGQGDYEIYSQDREWRRLMQQEHPEVELPPLSQEKIDSVLAEYEEKSYDSIAEYINDHQFAPSDYEIYSQDPEWRRLMEIEYPETELPPLNNADQISDYQNLDAWLKDINPNFDPYDIESPYCNNCGSCAYAVYRRLEGDTNIIATANNIGYNDEMTALTGMEQVSMPPEEIEARLLEQGNGAHAIIGIDRSEGPGHWFNAICKDEKVYAVDGQTGEINEWPPDYGDVVNWEMSIKKGDK